MLMSRTARARAPLRVGRRVHRRAPRRATAAARSRAPTSTSTKATGSMGWRGEGTQKGESGDVLWPGARPAQRPCRLLGGNGEAYDGEFRGGVRDGEGECARGRRVHRGQADGARGARAAAEWRRVYEGGWHPARCADTRRAVRERRGVQRRVCSGPRHGAGARRRRRQHVRRRVGRRMRHGAGKWTAADGVQLREGSWLQDKLHGAGIEVVDGEKYEGRFERGAAAALRSSSSRTVGSSSGGKHPGDAARGSGRHRRRRARFVADLRPVAPSEEGADLRLRHAYRRRRRDAQRILPRRRRRPRPALPPSPPTLRSTSRAASAAPPLPPTAGNPRRTGRSTLATRRRGHSGSTRAGGSTAWARCCTRAARCTSARSSIRWRRAPARGGTPMAACMRGSGRRRARTTATASCGHRRRRARRRRCTSAGGCTAAATARVGARAQTGRRTREGGRWMLLTAAARCGRRRRTAARTRAPSRAACRRGGGRW